jgi:hypothetical protein
VHGATITLEIPGTKEPFRLPLAGGWLESGRAVRPGARPARLPGPAKRAEGRWRLVYRGPALVEGEIQEVVARRGRAGERRIEFADGERFWVAAGGERVARLEGGAPEPPRERLLERALGAPLALALAARGVWLLHASALAGSGGGVVAVTGASGAGKSTLAAAAAREPGLRLARVADDILPVRLGAAPVALPHFPQLKLAPGEQYPAASPTALPLVALVEIEHSTARTRLETLRLSPADATLALVRATVAARLFDRALARAHFAACADASAALPVLRWTYPSGADGLRQVLAVLAGVAAGKS